MIFKSCPPRDLSKTSISWATGKADLAIVQLDALRFVSDVLKQQKNLNLFDSIKVILNLYPEEIHILSNKNDIQTFYQLEGKRLSVGAEGGGTAVTAAVLLAIYDIKATVSFEVCGQAGGRGSRLKRICRT